MRSQLNSFHKAYAKNVFMQTMQQWLNIEVGVCLDDRTCPTEDIKYSDVCVVDGNDGS